MPLLSKISSCRLLEHVLAACMMRHALCSAQHYIVHAAWSYAVPIRLQEYSSRMGRCLEKGGGILEKDLDLCLLIIHDGFHAHGDHSWLEGVWYNIPDHAVNHIQALVSLPSYRELLTSIILEPAENRSLHETAWTCMSHIRLHDVTRQGVRLCQQLRHETQPHPKELHPVSGNWILYLGFANQMNFIRAEFHS